MIEAARLYGRMHATRHIKLGSLSLPDMPLPASRSGVHYRAYCQQYYGPLCAVVRANLWLIVVNSGRGFAGPAPIRGEQGRSARPTKFLIPENELQ